MSHRPWKDDPLEYLVRCRFPKEQAFATALPSVRGRPLIVRDENYLKKAAQYRSELRKLDQAELLTQAEAAAKEEYEKALARMQAQEAAFIFNQPRADADIEHWSRMSLWTLDEAIALSLGKDPRLVSWDNVRSSVQISSFAARYSARRDIILRAKQAGQLWEQTIPGVFIAWADRMNVDLPSPLVDAIKRLGVQVADWKSAYDAQRKTAENATAELLTEKEESIRKTTEYTAYLKKITGEYGELINAYRARIAALEEAAQQQVTSASSAPEPIAPASQKSLGARERESLLKLVIGMAVGGYGYNPKSNRSDVISEIASDLEKAGVPLDVDTVRKYIREARELLPPPETEQND